MKQHYKSEYNLKYTVPVPSPDQRYSGGAQSQREGTLKEITFL